MVCRGLPMHLLMQRQVRRHNVPCNGAFRARYLLSTISSFCWRHVIRMTCKDMESPSLKRLFVSLVVMHNNHPACFHTAANMLKDLRARQTGIGMLEQNCLHRVRGATLGREALRHHSKLKPLSVNGLNLMYARASSLGPGVRHQTNTLMVQNFSAFWDPPTN